MKRRLGLLLAAGAAASCALPAGAHAGDAPAIDYGPISHSGLRNLGAAPTSTKLKLQLGLIASQKGIANAAKAASDPTSDTYGKYPSLSTLQKNWGASSSRRSGVTNAFKAYGVTAKVDETHLRVTATISIANAQKLFGTKWGVYRVGGEDVALPVDTPKPPSGIRDNVDTIAGMRVEVSQSAGAAQAPGGTPTRTGTPGTSCLDSSDPAVARGTGGLLPAQLLAAYGIAPLQAAGLRGQGARVAIVGEAPTPTGDLTTFRNCFGFPGTALAVHNAGSIKPILESSLDAQVIAMVAPRLSKFDLWVEPLDENEDDGDVEAFLTLLAEPVQAVANGGDLPHVISVSYGICEPAVKPYTAARTLVERQLAAEAALGITVVVASGDSGSTTCARGTPPAQLTSAQKQPAVSWPASSPWVLSVGGTNLTLDDANGIAATGPWNDAAYRAPYTASAGGGGGVSTLNARPWWQPAQSFSSSKRMLPDVAAFADASPGYMIVCSSGVQGCSAARSPSIAFVGGTSASTPLVAGMIALWSQQAAQKGLPRPGFVPPLLYAMAQRSPQAFVDVTQGNNAIIPGVRCCSAAPRYDLATGLGSPLADQVAALLGPRG